MPFASQKQRAFMYARHPEIAKRWRSESGPQKGLPTYSAGHGKRSKKSRSNVRRDDMIHNFMRKHGRSRGRKASHR